MADLVSDEEGGARDEPVLRVALVVLKTLEPGAAANVAALMMGQLARRVDGLYAGVPLLDRLGMEHAAIRYSTVVLKGGPAQLRTAAMKANAEEGIACVLFSQLGRSLHNAFEQYAAAVRDQGEMDLAGIGIAGRDEPVRALTRSFSLLT